MEEYRRLTLVREHALRVGQTHTRPADRRLEFARWLVDTGRLSEWTT